MPILNQKDAVIHTDSYLRLLNQMPGMAYRCQFVPSSSANVLDYELILEFVSSGAYKLFDIQPREMIGNNWNTLERMMTPYEAKRTHKICYEKAVAQQSYEVIYQIKLPKNEIKWVRDTGSGIYDRDGKLKYFEGLIMDISEQKLQELLLEEENKKLKISMKNKYSFGNIIGQSKRMRHLYEFIIKTAENGMNVIIYGETGCGKDLVARAIHEYSGLKGNYIPINCGAIPEQLMESEFFGHVKGAFSGAHSNKTGYVAAADGGTLFLDELGDLPLSLQVKLLRTLENKCYTPVGSTVQKKSSFRLISATNKDLLQMIDNQTMRSDFFYRVHVLSITLPPLRERIEDIPLLIEDYLERREMKYTIPLKIRIMMENYDWPGNIRELHNFLDRYIVMGDVALDTLYNTTMNKVNIKLSAKNITLDAAVMELEHHIITKTLESLKWHRGNSAKQLGLNLRTLQRKMKKLQILEN